ncbi:hypothetical protein BFW38_14725 [Terasakiispira papahanaumokuakeensis]|uniref:Lcl C-terminal domain-containing protein n=1 Tax=Terasakiispira papahanaumokuakeensis TaxID=197479 RepID=A0A1E2VCP6_9GAMM|nr:DUF1566 domain-containing protein [Terasakiispira papahanaumokuakeensis]ODC04596.1 hypothetical protein BFW38_14725 [Terasakiispira papahanaumokuakeensis]
MKKWTVLGPLLFSCLNANPLWADGTQSQAQERTIDRFVVNQAGEAFDPKTNLIWRRCSMGTTWQAGSGCVGSPASLSLEAAQHAARQAGEGWRVPTIDELYSLVDEDRENPAINTTVFPDITATSEGAPYWSVTPVQGMPRLIFFVDFMSGQVDGHTQGFALAARLVRSAEQNPQN